MKPIIISLFLIFSVTAEVSANCQWAYINLLNKDIKHANQLLSDYSVCRSSCQTLESNLKNSIVKMGNNSGCGANILTTKNSEMMNFIASRFKLIQKQKTGAAWAGGSSIKAVVAPVKTAIVPIKQTVSAAAAIEKLAPSKVMKKQLVRKAVVPVVRESPRATLQTKIMLSNEVYADLWSEDTTRRPRQNLQKTLLRKQGASHAEKQKRIANQRLIQHRKQALLQQKKMQLVKTKKLAMQHHLNNQRVQRQRLLKKRALARHLNRQKVRQQRLARAQRNRNRQ